MSRRRALIFVAIAAVVLLDAVLWLRLFTPDETTEDVSAAASKQSTSTDVPTESETSAPEPSQDDPGAESDSDSDSTRRIEVGSYTETVGLLETATLTGRYPDAPDGISLYLQRLSSDGWVTFPLPTVVTPSGRFRASAELGQPGPNRVRLVDPATQTTSDVVSINVR